MILVRKLMLSGVLLAAAAAAQEGGDLQAQILYAYQVEDVNSLTNLIQNLRTQAADNARDAALRYHLAHAEYRLGLVAGARHTHEAEAALSDCVDTLKPALKEDVKSVEALTLQSACYFALADHSKLEAVLLRSRASDRLKTALTAAPKNPRAVFLSASDGLAQSKPGSAQHNAAFAQLQIAVQLFEAASATNIETVGWGHAEAYLAMARELRARGDQLGARNWIEKALIVAPDYKAAQRQLAMSH